MSRCEQKVFSNVDRKASPPVMFLYETPYRSNSLGPLNKRAFCITMVGRHSPASMETVPKAKYQKLIGMMDAFVSGQNRSRNFVSEMEGEFATSDLDEDERFTDLQLVPAMFGASDQEPDEKMLTGKCRYALRLLKEEP